jgi:hypothetical protein
MEIKIKRNCCVLSGRHTTPCHPVQEKERKRSVLAEAPQKRNGQRNGHKFCLVFALKGIRGEKKFWYSTRLWLANRVSRSRLRCVPHICSPPPSRSHPCQLPFALLGLHFPLIRSKPTFFGVSTYRRSTIVPSGQKQWALRQQFEPPAARPAGSLLCGSLPAMSSQFGPTKRCYAAV